MKENNSDLLFSFSSALIEIKQGRLVQRSGWNGKGMFIFLYCPGIDRPQWVGLYYAPTAMYRLSDYIMMKTADGQLVPWLASQTDILAEDWHTVDYSETLKKIKG